MAAIAPQMSARIGSEAPRRQARRIELSRHLVSKRIPPTQYKAGFHSVHCFNADPSLASPRTVRANGRSSLYGPVPRNEIRRLTRQEQGLVFLAAMTKTEEFERAKNVKRGRGGTSAGDGVATLASSRRRQIARADLRDEMKHVARRENASAASPRTVRFDCLTAVIPTPAAFRLSLPSPERRSCETCRFRTLRSRPLHSASTA